MLKKALLSTLLLLSNFAVAQIRIDFDLTIESQPNVQNVTGSVITENGNLASFENGDLIIDILPQEDGDDLIVQANIYQRTDADEYVVVARPVVKISWNQPATIILSNEPANEDEATEEYADEDTDKLIFVITASQVE